MRCWRSSSTIGVLALRWLDHGVDAFADAPDDSDIGNHGERKDGLLRFTWTGRSCIAVGRAALLRGPHTVRVCPGRTRPCGWAQSKSWWPFGTSIPWMSAPRQGIAVAFPGTLRLVEMGATALSPIGTKAA